MASEPEITFIGTDQADAQSKMDEYFRLHPDELARFERNPNLAVELKWGPRGMGAPSGHRS